MSLLNKEDCVTCPGCRMCGDRWWRWRDVGGAVGVTEVLVATRYTPSIARSLGVTSLYMIKKNKTRFDIVGV